jgi:hypothetical protein
MQTVLINKELPTIREAKCPRLHLAQEAASEPTQQSVLRQNRCRSRLLQVFEYIQGLQD